MCLNTMTRCSSCCVSRHNHFFQRISLRTSKLTIFKTCNKCNRHKYKYKTKKENKVKHNAHNRVKIECECGCFINRNNISTHKKSKKHFKLIELKEFPERAMTCECGTKVFKVDIANHRRCRQHIRDMSLKDKA